MALIANLQAGFRGLVREPLFAFTAVAAIAVGIGANTAMFSVVNAVLLRPLPYPSPERLVALNEGIPQFGMGEVPFSPPDITVYEKRTKSYSSFAAFTNQRLELSGIDRPERISVTWATASLFPALGVQPVLGRAYTAAEEREGKLVAILSDALWRRAFGADSRIVGRSIELDRKAYVVIGVMPRSVVFPLRGPSYNNEPADLFVPASLTEEQRTGFGNSFNYSVIARLAPGVTVEQARAEALGIHARIIPDFYPPAFQGTKLDVFVRPLRDVVAGPSQRMLILLLAAVGLVLLIACADVASLLLTRAAGRQREMAIRAALGASRASLARKVLTESVVLAAIGGVAGTLVAAWGVDFLASVLPKDLPRLNEIRVDRTVLLFTTLMTLAAAAVFGLAPAVEASRVDLQDALRDGGRASSPGRRRQFWLRSFAGAQFALAVLLLCGAGLLARSFVVLTQSNPGFRPQQALTVSVALPKKTYPSALDVTGFYDRLLARTAALPGVTAAGFSTGLPLEAFEQRAVRIDNESGELRSIKKATLVTWVSGNYFDALGIPLKAGRVLGPSDGLTAPHVAVVNEVFARRFIPDLRDVNDAVKHYARFGDDRMQIVGVVGDVKHGPLKKDAEPHIYLSYNQEKSALEGGSFLREVNLIVRTPVAPDAMLRLAGDQVRALDPSLPVSKPMTLGAVIEEGTAIDRFQTVLLAVFAGVALLLAGLGVYGVLAYSVTQRTHEIGVRLALGAAPGGVIAMVLRQGLLVAGVGIAAGIALASVAARYLSTLLYGVSPYDPLTFLAAPAVLLAVAALAVYLPARRAARVDPMVALRYE